MDEFLAAGRVNPIDPEYHLSGTDIALQRHIVSGESHVSSPAAAQVAQLSTARKLQVVKSWSANDSDSVLWNKKFSSHYLEKS
mmetsp:Transcript_13281/g.31456  ORF Transcript_13281/g.31456 Transcript_13281/m.31456 type:complete len:83 (-) Transcript_13281:256-504(-)